MNIKLREPYNMFGSQRADLANICRYSHWCNFSEMGAGKTLPHALLGVGALEDNVIDYCLVVTRKVVIGDWLMTFRDMIDCDWQNLVTIYQAPRVVRPHMTLRPIVIMSWQTMCEDWERFVKLASASRCMVIFDEAHTYLRNMTGVRSRPKPGQKPTVKAAERLLYIAERCKRVYPLTGTPTPNGLKNAYPYIRLMTGTQYYKSYDHYKRVHFKYSFWDKRKLEGYREIDRATNLLSSFSTRHLKKDIMDLPPKTFQTRFLDWDKKQLELYEEMASNFMLEFDDHFLEALDIGARLVRLHQIITNPQQLGLKCDSTRFKAINEDLEDIGVDEHKVVIFAYYRDTIKRLQKQLSHFNPAVIYGGTTDIEREKLKFQKDDTCRVLIANPKSAGVGTNFTVAHYIIFFEYSYDLDDYDQAIDRCHRPGQKYNLTIINYALRGSMEPRKILPRLIEKKAFSGDLLNDPREFMDFIKLEQCDELSSLWEG